MPRLTSAAPSPWGDTFTLVVSKDGSIVQQTGPIAWSANRNTLVANIETALNAPSMETLFSAGLGFAQVALLSPVLDIFPNARLTVTGVIGDGANPADISLSGGGELSLAGTVQNALDALPSIGGSVTVAFNLSDLTSPVFILTLGGALSGSNQPLVTVPSISTGAATPFVVTDGSGGTVVANGAQVQLQGGITVVGVPIIIAGTGNPLATEVQSVSVTGPKYGSFQLTFTNPNPVPTTSTTVSLPIGATAAQVQNALNALASIQAGNGTGGGFVLVNDSGWNVYTVLFQGTFVGASQPWSKQAVTVRGAGGTSDLNFTDFAATAIVSVGATPAATEASLQTALTNLLSIPTSPGSGNGTVLVSLTSSGSFLITLGGSLANVSVPLLVASNFIGAPVPAVTIANQACRGGQW